MDLILVCHGATDSAPGHVTAGTAAAAAIEPSASAGAGAAC